MILHCDLDLEDSKSIFLEDNLAHSDASWITTPSLVVKGSAIQKISSGQTLTDISKFCCDLDLEHNNPILAYDMYNQTKFGSKRISSSKDTVNIVTFWS